MREMVPTISDNVHFREDGTRVPATQNIAIGLDGEWRELDLTDEHNGEFWEAFKRWWDAGEKIDHPPARRAPRAPRAPKNHERYEYFKGLRSWADDHGWTERYTTPGGSYYYPDTLRREYSEETGIKDPDAPDA